MVGALPLLVLLWNFPSNYTPPPDAFYLTYALGGQSSVQELVTPPSLPGACGEGSPDVYCTSGLACPGAGALVFFWVQAGWGDERSDASERLACTVRADCTCQVLATGLDAEGQPLPLDEHPYQPARVALPPAFTPHYPTNPG